MQDKVLPAPLLSLSDQQQSIPAYVHGYPPGTGQADAGLGCNPFTGMSLCLLVSAG